MTYPLCFINRNNHHTAIVIVDQIQKQKLNEMIEFPAKLLRKWNIELYLTKKNVILFDERMKSI